MEAKSSSQETCLITGGAGFIGSHLVDALLGMGYRVVVVDNFMTGKRDNLIEAEKNPNFTFIEYNVIDPFNNPPAGRAGLTIQQFNNLSYIFHLASPASPPWYQKYPEETALVNSVGTINMLKLAKQTGARFLFASTSEVYGDPKEHPQKESYWGNVNPNGVRACYDESKRFGEMISMVYHRRDKVDVRIARIFNTYGPRMQADDGRVVSNFVTQALSSKPLTVYGDGSQTRSFCYVSDMVEGLLKFMFTKGLVGEVVNLGNPEEYRVIDLAQKIKAMTGSNSPIVYQDLPEDDPVARRPDITKAIKLLEWQPKVPLDEGLTKTIEYYRNLSS